MSVIPEAVTALTFLDDHRVGVGRNDKTVTVLKWKASDRRNDQPPKSQVAAKVLKGHGATVTNVVYIPNRNLLISAAGTDKEVKLWNAGLSEETSRIQLPYKLDEHLSVIDFSSDSQILSVIANKGRCRSWAMPSLAERPGFGGGLWSKNFLWSVTYSNSDDKPLIATTHWVEDNDGRGYLVTVSADGEILVHRASPRW